MTWEQQIFQWLMSFVCFVSTWLVSCPKDNKEILHSNVLPPGRLHSRAFSLHNQQWWAPSDRTWKINYLNIWNIEYLKYWIFEILTIWNIEYLKYWIFEILNIWSFEYWKIIEYWFFEILIIESLKYWILKDQAGSCAHLGKRTTFDICLSTISCLL